MILDFLLSPITDKDTCTGAVLDNYAGIKRAKEYEKISSRQKSLELKTREVEALEKIAKGKG